MLPRNTEEEEDGLNRVLLLLLFLGVLDSTNGLKAWRFMMMALEKRRSVIARKESWKKRERERLLLVCEF